MNISLYMIAPTTMALGPFKRYALWVQGCNKRCPGCISPDAQPLDGGYTVEVEDLVHEILSRDDIEGITISGGEPFLQQDALCELIDSIRRQRDLGVILYTGMNYEEVEDAPLYARCDLIIDGEYIDELNDDLSLRGSSNQRIVCITDRYLEVADACYGKPGRKIELVQNQGSFNMIGIPSKGIIHTLIQGESK